jgi:DNA-binding transcriptional regulator YiaG
MELRKRSPWVEHDYLHCGCGFPVVLSEVRFIPWGKDDAIVFVDYRTLAEAVQRFLAEKPTRLTGHEVRFLRQTADLTLEQFGRLFDVTHPAVKKWESKGDNPTGMAWTTELAIRLHVLDRLGVKPREFRQAYTRLAQPRPEGRSILHLTLGDKGEPSEHRWQPRPAAS